MSEPIDPDERVTLTRLGELPAAQILCGRLESEGIECAIPDEIMAAQTWHLNRAIGGIRVQVRQADLERARQILESPGLPDNGEAPGESGSDLPASKHNGEDDSISVGDRAAYRSMRVALVSLWLMGLVHPYSLWLAVRALGRADLTAWGRGRAWIALLISLVGCAWMGLLVHRFATLAVH